MKTRPNSPRAAGEQGAFIVLWALLLVALFGMVAIVIDLGQARSTRRENQTIADMAALAATTQMKSTPLGVCTDAWEYLRANAPSFPPASSPCNGPPSPPSSCTPSTPQRTYERVSGPYTVQIIYPVASTPELGDSRFPAKTNRCNLLQVNVVRTNNTFFGGLLGLDQISPRAYAVAESATRPGQPIPAFWLLEPTACNVANLVGGSKITVGSTTEKGYAVFDTAANATSGCSPRSILGVGGAGSINVFAPPGETPELRAFALSQGCASPCHGAGTKVSPQPEASDSRSGRTEVDRRYLASINLLRDYVGSGTPPPPFTTSTNCSPSGGTAASPVEFPDNVFMNCPGGFTSSGHVRFNGNVVFAGSVSNSSGATLEFRRSATVPTTPATELTSFIYVRNGNFQNVNVVNFNNMMLYLHNGFISSTTGNGVIRWSPPPGGAFKGLSLWAETTQTSTFQGGSASCGSSEQVSLNGIFFLPNSQLTLQGGGTLCSTAQYISRTLQMNGGTQVQVVAPNDGVPDTGSKTGLIR